MSGQPPAERRGAWSVLRLHNYRLWAGGALVSNVGTWMQRIAQDWVVLTMLTHGNATAVGVVTALQLGPQMLLLPVTGYAADHMDRRRLLMATQGALALLALGMGILVLTGWVRLWQVDLFAFLQGCAAAFDAPARQTFVAELVGEDDLPAAVGINSASFNAGRLLGPAAAGGVIAAVGPGWGFLVNAVSFLGVLGALTFLRQTDLHRRERPARSRRGLIEGFIYVWGRPDLKLVLAMLFVVGALGFTSAIYISTMAVRVFHAGAGQYGILTSMMAVGSVAGALMAARRGRPTIATLTIGAAVFAVGSAAAALAPSYWLFGAILIVVGVSVQTFTTSTNSLVQLSTEPAMRGRVTAILMAVTFGGAPLGGPFVGWVADRFGPRWALGVAAGSGFAAAAMAVAWLWRQRAQAAAPQA